MQESLQSHAHTFDHLLSLIPPKYYLHTPEPLDGKYMHNKKLKAPKQAIKEASQKAKKLKLDPDQHQSVPQLQLASVADDALVTPMPSPTTVQDLKLKLQQRLQTLSQSRRGKNAANEPPKSRQEILAKRAQKKLDRKKKKEAQKKIAPTMSIPDLESPQMADVKSSTAKLKFGNLDFGEQPNTTKRKGPSDIASQLSKAISKKQKLQKLQETAPEKAQSIQESSKWSKVEALASGVKVKDDITLLKKSLKKKESIKAKSTKEWGQRKDSVQKSMIKKQQKRQENIQARIDAKKDARMNKGKGGNKKKKARPGFEGSKGKSHKK